ncbi:MAG: hypothetical protein ACK40L_19855, partial [Hydrogenophaga sp.]
MDARTHARQGGLATGAVDGACAPLPRALLLPLLPPLPPPLPPPPPSHFATAAGRTGLYFATPTLELALHVAPASLTSAPSAAGLPTWAALPPGAHAAAVRTVAACACTLSPSHRPH